MGHDRHGLHLPAGGRDPRSVAAARVVVGGALLLGWALYRRSAQAIARAVREQVRSRRRRPRPGVPAGPPLVIRVALGGVAEAAYQLSFFTALAQTGVAVGTVVSMSTPPVFAGLFVVGWLRQRLTATFAAATTVTIAGCVLTVIGGSTARVDVSGMAMAGVAGLAFATYSASAGKLISAGLPPTGVMASLLATSAMLSLADPGVAALLGLLVLSEPARPTTLVGLALLLVGLALVAFRSGERR